jgi:hypothetical protein
VVCVVLYDFAAEERFEVAHFKEVSLDVAHEVGGWLHVRQTRHILQCVWWQVGFGVSRVAGWTMQ